MSNARRWNRKAGVTAAPLFGRASGILTDDHAQYLALSDFGQPVKTGVVAADSDRSFGDVLGGRVALERKPGDITIADLTVLAAQDIAIANLFSPKLVK
jgi:ornithine cyclodeaminase